MYNSADFFIHIAFHSDFRIFFNSKKTCWTFIRITLNVCIRWEKMSLLFTLRLPIQEYAVSPLFKSSFITLKIVLSFPSCRPCVDMSRGFGLLLSCFGVAFQDVSSLLSNSGQLSDFLPRSYASCHLPKSCATFVLSYPFVLDAFRRAFNS